MPSQPYPSTASRILLRNVALLIIAGGAAVVFMMAAVDIPIINLMPPRGSGALWPVRYFTDLAKDVYVILAIGVVLLVTVVVRPAVRGARSQRLALFEAHVAFLLLAVGVPDLIGAGLKSLIGRGRPFVGGAANAFNFLPLSSQEAFSSLPSAHAITAFALAYAVAALWPKTRYVMAVYALLIAVSRVVLLAHHPSDVLAGALVGILGAMVVRYWFACRHLAFAFRGDGRIEAVTAPLT